MKRIDWRHQYDEKRDKLEADACCVQDFGPSLTQQQFTEDSDVNVIARRFGLTGTMPVLPIDPSHYGDFTNAPDLREALEILRDADEQFMSLPPNIRSRFDNSPAKLWDFIHDPANREEGQRLGIFNPPEPPETVTYVTKLETPT